MVNIFEENKRGIRVSEHVKNKIKRAAIAHNMTMVEYLDSIVPEIKMEEIRTEDVKCQQK